MKFTDLPLNVPVLLVELGRPEFDCEVIRINATDSYWRELQFGGFFSFNHPQDMTWMSSYTILDAPTDADAAECGVSLYDTYSQPADQFATSSQTANVVRKVCTCPSINFSLRGEGCKCGGR